MKRWLVAFKSHAEPPADITCVGPYASSPLKAIRAALKHRHPMHPWIIVQVWPWPDGIGKVEEAAEKLAGMRR